MNKRTRASTVVKVFVVPYLQYVHTPESVYNTQAQFYMNEVTHNGSNVRRFVSYKPEQFNPVS